MKHHSEAFFFKPVSWFEPFQWKQVFSASASQNPESIHVDIGAGDGGFVCQRARNHPEMNFLAVERLLGRARKIARRALREQLAHVRVARIEAAYAVERLFPASSIHTMTILFPDPWPKRRHHKNRLIQRSFLERCATCLRADGWLAIKTDDASYFEQISDALAECKGLKRWQDVQPEILLPETTDFEREFLKEKRSVWFVAARRA